MRLKTVCICESVGELQGDALSPEPLIPSLIYEGWPDPNLPLRPGLLSSFRLDL